MKFDVSNIHTIFEAKEESVPEKNLTNDETGANLDNTLGDNDLLSIFDDICPITGDVFASMKNAAADPKNLKITMVKNGNGEDPKLFIEAVEFMTFCEANDCNPGEAEEKIIDVYKEEIPEMDNAELHVVFPSDSLNKDVLGSENYGRDVKNDWAMQLMRGCRRYGLKVNSGVENLQEGFFQKNKEPRKTEYTQEELGKIVSIAKNILNKQEFKNIKKYINIYGANGCKKYPNNYVYGTIIGSVSSMGFVEDDFNDLADKYASSLKSEIKSNEIVVKDVSVSVDGIVLFL